ncbi:MAG: multiheme c-type cytochrome [Verrucomicrobiota bacterium]
MKLFIARTRLISLFLVSAGLIPAFAAPESAYHADPAKILGAENCTECHASMVEAWKLTHHFDTFNSMHRRPEAKEIATKLGMRRIKDESLCLKCHYTTQAADDGKVTAISGISCESCHGAGKDWNKVHNAKDDPARLVKAEKLGMLRPNNYYHVAANCFSCHTVPEENLVNVGGHKAGSDFELVSWLSGEVRHNMQKSAGKINEPIPQDRQRMLYITGRALDLEYSLRGLAKATKDGPYYQGMLARVKAAKDRLAAIEKATSLPEVKAMLEAVKDDLKPGSEAAISKMAEDVSENASKLAKSQDGSKLASVDSLIPGPDKYKGTAYKP